jgi:hypothetical protein
VNINGFQQLDQKIGQGACSISTCASSMRKLAG